MKGMNEISDDAKKYEKIPILISNEELLKGFTKHKDVAFVFSFASIGSISILIGDLINNRTFPDPFFMLLVIITTPLAYIFINMVFLRQMKIYYDGISMPTRPIIRIILGKDNYIPLDHIIKCSISLKPPVTLNSEERVLFQTHIRHRFKRTATDHIIGKHFILDFIRFAGMNKNWDNVVNVESEAMTYLLQNKI